MLSYLSTLSLFPFSIRISFLFFLPFPHALPHFLLPILPVCTPLFPFPFTPSFLSYISSSPSVYLFIYNLPPLPSFHSFLYPLLPNLSLSGFVFFFSFSYLSYLLCPSMPSRHIFIVFNFFYISLHSYIPFFTPSSLSPPLLSSFTSFSFYHSHLACHSCPTVAKGGDKVLSFRATQVHERLKINQCFPLRVDDSTMKNCYASSQHPGHVFVIPLFIMSVFCYAASP